MDAITMLKDDHDTVERLFTRYEKAGDRAYVEKRRVVDRIIEELAVHAAIEEQLFYPVVRDTVPEVRDETLESLEEHHLVKIVLAELEGMDPHDERFDAKVTVLMENVRHHVEEEEGDLFPKVRKELGNGALSDLGDAMEGARALAPTHPHPGAPDTPPGNLVVGTVAGIADRVSDAVSGLAQGGVSAVNDLVATILRRERSAPSPTGSSQARDTAEAVRERAADATDAVIEATREAKDRAERTADQAKRGASRTSSAARQGAKRTANTAQKGARKTGKAAEKGAQRTAAAARGKKKAS